MCGDGQTATDIADPLVGGRFEADPEGLDPDRFSQAGLHRFLMGGYLRGFGDEGGVDVDHGEPLVPDHSADEAQEWAGTLRR